MITVVCGECARTQGRTVTAEFTTTDEAQRFIRRHHALADHRAHVEESHDVPVV
ncbi:hypothetical protein FDG57_gp075 [Mycobacterium phage Mutaforma13]|uniref:Uncharacterized protein n=2 Tax=Cheoctovirus TaxID=1623281 RepID=A0A385UES4_9CAUD|nr:hypothetical protein FDG57_gp075 [Mycobacterium phage Mutaforma13]YP_009957472.1 hypothetical protein I5H41_gp069 [Mycobacterium phage Galactic]UVK63056.1 hypothetical protein SEA_BEAKIN_70 [Mycobacterium phage Beakin]WNM74052.1 hypothetical protein SEA_LUNABLU_72 [Mycobacterium Phage LunaBlu]AEJ93152.1 hypothetical protein MUTAFORMA13_75 [Mycobacterium phage Mutaforma13]AYB69303.1 hypothetical protein SEA_GALACTIC_69 [Mycobacterium phage Galactic]